jgi:hypothetical protein
MNARILIRDDWFFASLPAQITQCPGLLKGPRKVASLRFADTTAMQGFRVLIVNIYSDFAFLPWNAHLQTCGDAGMLGHDQNRP